MWSFIRVVVARPSTPTTFVDRSAAVAIRAASDGSFTDRHFKYLLVLPAIFLILLIGLFPLVYTLLVSFQNVTMLAEDTSFHGLANYTRLLHELHPDVQSHTELRMRRPK